MIWPRSLAQVAINKALHNEDGREDDASGWKISRLRFFLIAFAGMFVYYVSLYHTPALTLHSLPGR